MAEKTLTKEEWAKVDKAMSGRYGAVDLIVDDHKISLSRELVGKNKLGIVIYVNGSWKGKWIGKANDCQEQRYCYPMARFVYTAKSRAAQKKIIKQYGKRRSAEIGLTTVDIDSKIIIFMPMFPSVTAFRRHYEKTFNSIELIKADSI